MFWKQNQAKSIRASDGGQVLLALRPPLWFGIQFLLFRKTVSGVRELPGTLHSWTAHASLCGGFSSLIPTRFHYNGNPLDRRHPRVSGMEDNHDQVYLDSFSSINLPGTHYLTYHRGGLRKVSA